jgi:cadmium resistance protein CadD (predicted permease)
VLFAGTNADDIVVLTVLNISSRIGGRPRRWQIWAGQYAGFTVLVAVSLAAACGVCTGNARGTGMPRGQHAFLSISLLNDRS